MAAASPRQHQHSSSESELGPTAHHPRSLNSMLANSRRALPSDSSISNTIEEVPEGELAGESEFIALNDDVAPLFQARLLSSPAGKVDSRDTSSRELLKDLFPTGFTSNALSPLATAAAAPKGEEADGFEPASARTLGEAEPELKGRQVWACLVPKAVPATAVVSPNGAPGVDRETELYTIAENARNKHLGQSPLHPSWGPSHQPYGYSELHQPNCCDELDSTYSSKVRERDATAKLTDLGSSNVKMTTATRRADLGAPPPGAADSLTTRSKTSFVSDGGGHRVVVKMETAEVARRERESDLKHALDRLVSRLVQSQERVKFLEGNLEQAKHVESGRNALIQQITRLEEDVKHARHRLETHRAEALEWREKRQALEADNERLGAELHSALGRNTRLETDNRRKDGLLAEVRKSADARAENNSTLEAELRRRDQLLEEAERHRKQAWPATSASAEAAKAAITRAEATVKQASDLRFIRGDAGGQHVTRSDENNGFALEVGQSGNRHSQPLTDVVMAATCSDGGYGGLGKPRRSFGPTEANLLQRAPLVEQYGDRHRARYHSPETGSSANRSAAPPKEDVSRGQHKLGRSPTSDSVEGFSIKSNGAPTVPPPQPTVTTTDCRTSRSTPRTVFFDDGRSDGKMWSKEDRGVLSPTREPPEPTKNLLTPGSGRRMRVVEKPPPAVRATGREQCYDGDRQRHDSEGVKGALTGANPAWTDAPSSFGGGSSTGVRSSGGGGGGGAAGGEEFVRSVHTFGREAGDVDRLGEEAHRRNEESRDHADEFSTGFHGRVIDEVGPRVEVHGVPAADEMSPVTIGWTLQQVSPHCPAAGHRRGRDVTSSRSCSLSGAGVGVSAEVTGEANETSPMGVGGKGGVVLSVGGAIDAHHGVGDGPFGGQQLPGEGARGYVRSPSTAAPAVSAADNQTLVDHRKPATSSSVKSRQRVESLASLLGNEESPRDSGAEERSSREKRAPAPFATDAAEDELRPVREVERRLMLLQMEMSQLEAEQSKLVPKASKTMQARVQLQQIDSRLALLASESSGLRRILREKPWRM